MIGLANAQSAFLNKLKLESQIPTYTASSFDEGASSVMIKYDKIVEFYFDQKREFSEMEYDHRIVYIKDDLAVNQWNKIYIPQYSFLDDVDGFKARVIKNGKVVSEVGVDDLMSTTEDGTQFKTVALKGVEVGSIIEYYSTTKVRPNIYDATYIVTNSPTLKCNFTLIAPRSLKFKLKGYNGLGEVSDSTKDEYHFYYVSKSNVPAYQDDESYCLENANKLRVEYAFSENLNNGVKASKFAEMARKEYDQLHANLEADLKIVKLFTSETIKSGMSAEEKILACENELKTKYSSLDNSSIFQIPGLKFLFSFNQMYYSKISTPYNNIKMLILAYESLGIKTELVITCKKDWKRFDKDFDSDSYLNNFILYFPEYKKYLDPNNKVLRYGMISEEYLGQHAISVKQVKVGSEVKGVANSTQIPGNVGKDSYHKMNINVSFNNGISSNTITQTQSFAGYHGAIRYSYFRMNEDDRKSVFEGTLKGLASHASVNNLKFENGTLDNLAALQKPFVVSGEIVTSDFLENAGDKALLKVGELIGQQDEMYFEKPRQNPINIEYNHNFSREIVINIPQGYTVKGLDKLNMNFAFKNEDGSDAYGFVSSYKLEGNKLIITVFEYYYVLELPKEKYEDFSKVVNAAADFNKISILFEKL